METVKTGWLEKKSVMRWQKRWFALYRKRDSSRAWFAYFDGEQGVLDEARVARAKGAVELSWGAKVDVLPGAGSRFQVILAKHALKCGAADDGARDAWMRALRCEASHAVRSATVQFAGRKRSAKFPTSKAPISAVFHSSADFWTSDHLSERSRRVDAFSECARSQRPR